MSEDDQPPSEIVPPDPIITINDHGVILSASAAVSRVFGWTPDELVGRDVSMLMPEPHASAHPSYLAHYRDTGDNSIIDRTRAFAALHRNGRVFPIDLTVTKFVSPGGGLVFIGHIRDTSEQQRILAEQWLIHELAMMLSDSPSLRGALIAAIRKICEVTGWDYGEAWVSNERDKRMIDGSYWRRPQSGLSEFVHALHRAQTADRGFSEEIWASGVPVLIEDLSTLHFPENPPPSLTYGIFVPIIWESRPVASLFFLCAGRTPPGGRLIEMVRDAVTPLGGLIKRRQTEDELRVTKEWMGLALDASRAAAWGYHFRDHRLESWNPKAHELLGLIFSPSTTLRDLVRHVHRDDRESVRRGLISLTRGQASSLNLECRVMHPQRGERWIASYGQLLRDDQGRNERIAGVSFDITEHKANEIELLHHREQLETLVRQRTAELAESNARLRIADRLASIGTLAAGLGHDMNNILLPIKAHMNALRAESESASAPPGSADHLREIERCIAYLQQLADGMHHLAQNHTAEDKDDANPRTTNLHAWWSQVGAILLKAIPREIEVRVDLPQDLPPIAVPPYRLTQAMLNLLVNASEALGAEPPPNPTVGISAREDRRSRVVRLRVRDNGPGMSEGVRKRAFDMFYTTKPNGRGTGLGLPLVQSVAQEAGGHIELDSSPGDGTSITLVFPAARIPPTMPSPLARPPRVAMTLGDERQASLIEQLLATQGIVPQRATDPPDDTDYWVVDPMILDAGCIQRWQQSHPRGRLAIVSPPPPLLWEQLTLKPDTIISSGNDLKALQTLIQNIITEAMHDR